MYVIVSDSFVTQYFSVLDATLSGPAPVDRLHFSRCSLASHSDTAMLKSGVDSKACRLRSSAEVRENDCRSCLGH